MTTAIFKYFGLPGRTEQKITGKTKKTRKEKEEKLEFYLSVISGILPLQFGQGQQNIRMYRSKM